MKKLIMCMVLVIGAVPATAQSVKITPEPGVDLARYKTYAWAQPIPLGNPIVVQTVIEAIDQAMAAKGLKMVENAPELTIAFWTATESDLHIAYPTHANPSLPSLANAMPAGSLTWPVTKGTLVVNLADAATKSTVWRATASQVLEQGPTGNADKDAKRIEKPLRKAVQKMFKKFPGPK